MQRRTPRRLIAVATTLGLLLSLGAVSAGSVVAAPSAGKPLQVTAPGLTGFGAFAISGGQGFPVTVTVSNTGKNTINAVVLQVGADGDPTSAANGDANPPVALPTGVTVAAAGCTPAGGGSLITCDIGTLRAKQSRSFEVTFSTAELTTAVAVATKATVTGAESGNDSGSNQDTYSIEGTLNVSAFSCESVTVYKPGSDKTAATCSVTDERNDNHQSALVILPANLKIATVQENETFTCPFTTCLGDEVQAEIEGDLTSDTVVWTVKIDLTAEGASVPNPQKIVVWHQGSNATDPVQTFELSKKNACKTATQQLCGAASIETIDGHQILTITFQTGGNGKSRFT